jgi:GNAT superfamily N-acetyltransferase
MQLSPYLQDQPGRIKCLLDGNRFIHVSEAKHHTGIFMQNDIKIRLANQKDVDSLVVLSEQLGYQATAEEITERLPKLQGMDEHAVFVAVSQDDRVLGWIHVFISHRLVTETYAELGGLVVADGHRSLGIGEQLVDKAEQWAEEKGLDVLRIRARSSRERAHQFYVRVGYQLWKDQKVFEKFLHK